MDETNAPRVHTAAAEVEPRPVRDREMYALSVRLSSTWNPNKVCGGVLDTLTKAGFIVETIRVREDRKPAASYTRERASRS